MVRHTLLTGILGLLMAAAPLCLATGIVVLGETPVAEFTLPDGSVLKNAFVWRRSSEGLMVVHDDGQFFLNYKLLPDDWKAAYLGEVEVVAPLEPESPPIVLADRYKLATVLDAVPRLTDEGVEWLLREDAADDAGPLSLTLAVFQSLVSNNRDKAKRYFLIIEERGFKTDAVKLDKMFNKCAKCSGKGEYEQDCPACDGSGECVACEGSGLEKFGIGKSKQDCEACEGSGECPTCGGEKIAVLPCSSCRGRGQTLDRQYCEVHRDHLVRMVNVAAGGGEVLALSQYPSSGVAAMLGSLPGLDPEAGAFYLSEAYSGAMDTHILVACVMQSLLKGRLKEADRFNLMIEALFPRNKLFKIDDYLKQCNDCKSTGSAEQECPACKKEKGKCSECNGKGVVKPALGARGECEVCEGSGECTTCKGDGTVTLRCETCDGRGRLFEEMRAGIKLEILVDDLNDHYAAFLKKKEPAR
ncbi:MAG: hypothetical protein U9P12_03700 [Verrucomicrobiota bacterium]|nr:hypothetical protein [Verrucomicrobiota bacterium]